MTRRRLHGFTLVELLVVVGIIALLLALITPSFREATEIAYKARCRAHLCQLMRGALAYAGANDSFLPGMRIAVDYEWYLDNGGTAPPDAWGWKATIPTSTGLLHRGRFVQEPKIWLCPKALFSCPADFYHNNATDPYTYHFTVNRSTMRNYGAVDTHRSLQTFGSASDTILLAEENSGMIPECSEVINDPWFTPPDITEPRHMGMSQAGFLDGHAHEVEPGLRIYDMEEYCPPPY
jgi:prepilin-type N-terminal cleavage/methylation domain-containing protein/prepilin-type processing-associated H-X9-DG protein